MSDAFGFETFVDVHSNIFEEYLSSVIAKLPKENEEYRAIQSEIEELYEKYPKVLDVFDMEKSAELSGQECTALIKVMELKNKLTDMEMQSVYFRGCYDSAGYMKKAGILQNTIQKKWHQCECRCRFLHNHEDRKKHVLYVISIKNVKHYVKLQ